MTEDEGREMVNGELFGAFMKITNAQFSRCLDRSIVCAKPAIRAHSIQNARVLDAIASDGHVVAPIVRSTCAGGPVIRLDEVGRNKASTFSGLCAEHDRQIFSPLEVAGMDLDSDEHRFLLAYRAAYRELHACMETAMRLQAGYLERVERGLDPKGVPTEAGILAAVRMGLAHEMFRYKVALDDAYASCNFAALSHDLVVLRVEAPTVAVCSLFSFDHEVKNAESLLRVHLNVLPLAEDTTVALFSYRPEDQSPARARLDRVLNSSGQHQKYELSRLILQSCENFVLRPDYFDSWGEDKVLAVEAYFSKTLVLPSEDESPHLYLF